MNSPCDNFCASTRTVKFLRSPPLSAYAREKRHSELQEPIWNLHVPELPRRAQRVMDCVRTAVCRREEAVISSTYQSEHYAGKPIASLQEHA